MNKSTQIKQQKLRRRKRRIRRKIGNLVSIAVLSVILLCLVRVLLAEGQEYIEEIEVHSFIKPIEGTDNLMRSEEEIPDGYIAQADAQLSAPIAFEDDELREQIKTLAEEDSAYETIYENYDRYPEQLMSALCSNQEILPYVQGFLYTEAKATGGFTKEEKEESLPLLIQWDERWGYASYGSSRVGLSGCAPTCLSMVVLALTGNENATPDQIATYAEQAGYYQEGVGTSWSLMTEGCEHYGVRGREIGLDEDVIREHLACGDPIICSMRPGDFTTSGHFIVLTGVADGKIIINDPNSRKRSAVLWDYDTIEPQIRNLWVFTKG